MKTSSYPRIRDEWLRYTNMHAWVFVDWCVGLDGCVYGLMSVLVCVYVGVCVCVCWCVCMCVGVDIALCIYTCCILSSSVPGPLFITVK